MTGQAVLTHPFFLDLARGRQESRQAVFAQFKGLLGRCGQASAGPLPKNDLTLTEEGKRTGKGARLEWVCVGGDPHQVDGSQQALLPSGA